MMMHTQILTATLLLVSTSPAYAYMTPEQVLQQTQYGTYVPDEEEGGEYYAAPEDEGEPEKSGIHYVAPHGTYRIQESQGPPSTLKKYQPAAPVEEEAAEEEVTDEEVMPEEDGDSIRITIDSRTARLLERLPNPTHAALSENVVSPAAHSGAPLAPTGPATVVAMGTILAAVAWTIRRARKLERL